LDDANEEVIRKRLSTYEVDSKPVLRYYSTDRISTVDATQPPAKVLFDILASVNDGLVPKKHESAAVAAAV
jgi:adenylate kinase